MSLVEEAVRNWENFRNGVIAEIENTPEEHLDYRPGDGARTLREVAFHIALWGVGVTDEILKAEGSPLNVFKPEVQKALRERLPAAHSKAELLALLRQTGEEIFGRLRAAGDELISQTIQGRAGPQSRLSAVWFAGSHEMYHRGQLTAYERGFGTVPALTNQLAAMLGHAPPA
jgi:uncharacterized damage-inducible protein DinB